jgi:hypothetical protein
MWKWANPLQPLMLVKDRAWDSVDVSTCDVSDSKN